MLKKAAAITVALFASTAAAGETPDDAESLDYPHAGISLKLARKYVCHAPNVPMVLQATAGSPDAKAASISLTVIPAADGETPESKADDMIAALRRNVAFRDIRVVKRQEMEFAELPGRAVLLSYTCRGESCRAAVGLLIRELSEGQVRICYVLSVETPERHKDRLTLTFGDVIKSIRLSEVRHPSALAAGELGESIEDYRLGFSIRAPHGWSVARRYGGVVLVQADYLLGGELAFKAVVQVAEAPPEISAKAYVEESLSAGRRKGEIEVIRAGPADLGELSGYQVILRPLAKAEPATRPATRPATQPATRPATRPASQPATEPAEAEAEVLIVQRAACVPGPEEKKALAYSLGLICRGVSAERAAEIMAKLASGFRLIEVEREGEEDESAESEAKEKAADEGE
ncbi:MAG: hypothetical protein ACYTF6_03980 [Planctomycetota bacterium]|jgi:hypothetical protein